MRAIVTGGMGFIGSHLVNRLIEAGCRAVVLDDLSTGRRANLDDVGNSPLLDTQIVDISDYEAIKPHFSGIDVVFHLAGLADIVPSISNPARYFHANVNGTMAVAEAARHAGIKRIVYAASSSCYGIPDIYPTEETAAIRPQYPYALTKWLGEQILLHWAKVYRFSVISLRLFNVYGPRSRTTGTYGAVFGVFLAQRLRNAPLTIVGDGTQSRDFVYVSDVVDAFVAAAASDISHDVFNVGGGSPQTVNRLAELIGGPTVNIPKRPGEPDVTHADITKINRVLGWSPRVPFERGVSLMLSRIKDWADAPVWTPGKISEATREWFQFLSPDAEAGK